MKNIILAWFATMVAGLTGLGLFMKKYGPNIFKGISIARMTLNLIDEILEAVKPEADGTVKITPEEVKKFEFIAAKLREELR